MHALAMLKLIQKLPKEIKVMKASVSSKWSNLLRCTYVKSLLYPVLTIKVLRRTEWCINCKFPS